MKKLIIGFLILCSLFTISSLSAMEKTAAPPMKRTYSICPQILEQRRVLASDDVEAAKESIKRMPNPLILQYQLYISATNPEIADSILTQMRRELKKKMIEDLAAQRKIRILDICLSFTDPTPLARYKELDTSFLRMLTELKQELLSLEVVKKSQSMQTVIGKMPDFHEPKTLVIMTACIHAHRIYQLEQNLEIELSKLPLELRPHVRVYHSKLRKKALKQSLTPPSS